MRTSIVLSLLIGGMIVIVSMALSSSSSSYHDYASACLRREQEWKGIVDRQFAVMRDQSETIKRQDAAVKEAMSVIRELRNISHP